MKRRDLGKTALSSVAMASLPGIEMVTAKADTPTPDPSLLTTSLTPFGSERAGNADGSIPAWTGGYTTIPEGRQPGDYIGELFPDEQPVVVIDSSNMANYADRLSVGQMTMMTKYGFKIKVYPTHRTSAAPQSVYDAIAQNATRAKLDPGGGRLGFYNACGGIPFPIPDTSDPLVAGAQIINNHVSRWEGYAYKTSCQSWVVSSGSKVLSFANNLTYRYPYYQASSLADYNGLLYQFASPYAAPQNLVGQNIIVWAYSEAYKFPQQAWELLNGQGRVRRAPEVSFDTPQSQYNGIAGADETYGFNGSLEKYDWKFLGKKEMYIPYNNNAVYGASPQEGVLEHFIDPDLVRFELHRCWVVEATLHPGERNVLARRRFYVDEDTWRIGMGDMWDASDNLFKTSFVLNNVRPDLPGVVYGNTAIYNLQTDNWLAADGPWDGKTRTAMALLYANDFPTTTFDPNSMAANAQY